MLRCPTCQTEYLEGQMNCCPNCGWDLTPYPIAFQIPDELLRKEQAKVAWAKNMGNFG